MTKKLISTIIPTYNRAEIVLTAINSIIAQTHRPIELIIVDDGSTDNTQEVISEVQSSLIRDESFVLKYIKQKNQGPSAARNTGIDHAAGDYIHFQDSDDYLLPEAYDVCLSKMQQEGADLCQFGIIIGDKEGGGEKYVYPYKSPSLQDDILLARSYIGYTYSFIRTKSVIEKTGKWNTNLRIAEDREYLFRSLIHAKSVIKIDQCFYYYRMHDLGNIMDERNTYFHYTQILDCEKLILKHILQHGLEHLVSYFKISCYKKAIKAHNLGYNTIGNELGNLALSVTGKKTLRIALYEFMWRLGPLGSRLYFRMKKFRSKLNELSKNDK